MSKGVAFGADSGTVALATGEASMPIPQSVKVTFKADEEYMDFRDSSCYSISDASSV
jgi:aconitate hydratase 2/2-methylisocitrate dehydratase